MQIDIDSKVARKINYTKKESKNKKSQKVELGHVEKLEKFLASSPDKLWNYLHKKEAPKLK